ncbi:VWA domain-containing protein [Streptomyces sp. NPDC055912]|uniref:VWA domain-containing protein n=1 Tax=Streptomyces sp. NPDC055912 TaxID=3345660 RepID=UPI0035DF7204
MNSTTTADDSRDELADADLAEARDALGRRLATIINSLADRTDVLLDMVWDRSDSADAAWFDSELIAVTVNGAVALDQDTHPDDVDPLTVSGRLRHPVIIGMSAHEAAHARSTQWNAWRSAAGPAVIKAAVLLEEPRIEARHLQERPGDRVFLRACARNIVLPPQSAPSAVAQRWRAAAAAALVLGRVDAGVLTPADAEPVRVAVKAALGALDLAKARKLWLEVLALADGDQDGLLDVARRWVELVGAQEDDEFPGVGCAAGTPEPAGEGASAPGGADADPLGVAVSSVTAAVSIAAQISTGALIDPEETRRHEEEAALRNSRARAEESARSAAEASARRVFAPAPSSARARARNPVSGHRHPTPQERVAARRLGAALLKAQFRDPTRTRVPSFAPPGRLSGRDAMLGAAQRSMGLPVTARPFRATVRQHSEEPPVAVGVAVDVSGSMKAYTSVLASTAWTFAHGTQEISGTAATVAFGSAVTPVVSPGRPPTQVSTFTADDASHRFTEAVNALDGALGLARPVGARVLVIVSDGHWEPAERRGGERLVKRLVTAGVHVLWFCLDPRSEVLPGAQRLSIRSVADIPTALSGALITALRHS